MSFVQAKCVNCSGLLTVEPGSKTAYCPHCGVTYTLENPVNYHNSITKIENLHADVVNISDEKSSDGLIAAADAYVRLGKYSQAGEKYGQATSLAPQNWRGWCGLIVAGTHNFTKRIQSKGTLITLEDYARSAEAFATEGECNNIILQFREYEAEQKELNSKEITKLNDSVGELENKLVLMDKSEKDCRSSIEQANVDRKVVDDKLTKVRQSIIRPISRISAGTELLFGLFLKVFIKGLLGLKVFVILSALAFVALLIRSRISESKLVRSLRDIDKSIPKYKRSVDNIRTERIKIEHEKEAILTTLKAYE